VEVSCARRLLIEELGLITGSAYGGSMTGLDDGTLPYSQEGTRLGDWLLKVGATARCCGVAIGFLGLFRSTGGSQ